jgi:hypothetical protein
MIPFLSPLLLSITDDLYFILITNLTFKWQLHLELPFYHISQDSCIVHSSCTLEGATGEELCDGFEEVLLNTALLNWEDCVPIMDADKTPE